MLSRVLVLGMTFFSLVLLAESIPELEKPCLSEDSGHELYEVTSIMCSTEYVYEVDALFIDQSTRDYFSSHMHYPECRKALNPKNTCHISFGTRVAKS